MNAAPELMLHEFATPDALAAELSQTVADALREAIAARGAATLVVSGGTTPKRFFGALSKQELDWRRVVITLADERWVDASHARSNARLVADTLLQNAAAAARFEPLFDAAYADPDAAIPTLTTRLQRLAPFDAALLGMGEDGHFASLFPGGDHLDEGLDPQSPALLVSMHAANAGEPRISLTLSALLAVRRLFLHIEGGAKMITLDRVLNEDGADLPIFRLLQERRPPLSCFWCP